MERSVVRLISPGTLVEDTLLSPRRSNYLCALSSSPESDHYGFSVVDISTGELAVHNVGESQLASLLARYDPREVLVSPSLQSRLPPSLQQYLRATGSGIVGVDSRLSDSIDCNDSHGDKDSLGGNDSNDLINTPKPEPPNTNQNTPLHNTTPSDDSTDRSCILTTVPEPAWSPEPLATLIASHSALSALQSPLATGLFSHLESAALAALLHYVNVTQMGSFPRVFLEEQETLGVLELDRNTRESLNLTRGSRDSPLGSVLHVGPAGVSSPDHR